MATNSYPRTSRRDQREPAWKRKGFGSREEMNQARRFDHGTNGGRQRPRDRKPAEAFDLAYVGDRKAQRIGVLFETLDALAGPEWKYPRDGGLTPLYAEGDALWTKLDDAPATVTQAFVAFERLRYRIQFGDVSLALTQGQLLAVIDAGRAEAFAAFSADLVAAFLELMAYREVVGLKRGSRRKDARKGRRN